MSSGLEILNLHAQGGMAEVYKAQATDADGRVWYYAVKRIKPELVSNSMLRRMFVDEQAVAARLLHENIVRVYDVAHGDGSETYIVMEFLEGKDLSQVIEVAWKKRPLPVWFVIHVARATCHALHYASTQATDKAGRPLGLVHRDVSPHNVFVCHDGQVKLMDFGVARVEHAEVKTQAGVIKGKLGYMSPEQLSAGDVDGRSDLYNVGILLYEALSGQPLFHGDTASQFIASMMKNVVPPLNPQLHVPPELDSLMRRALSKQREERPVTALAFDAELNAIAGRYGLHAQRGHVAAEMKIHFGGTAPPDSIGPTFEIPRQRVITTQVPLVHEARASTSSGFNEPTLQMPQFASVPSTDPTAEVRIPTEPRRRAIDFSVGMAKTEPEGTLSSSVETLEKKRT